MNYDRLTPTEREYLDYLMNVWCGQGPYIQSLATRHRVKPHSVKCIMRGMFHVYGIDRKRYIPSVRLVYLRAKELGYL